MGLELHKLASKFPDIYWAKTLNQLDFQPFEDKKEILNLWISMLSGLSEADKRIMTDVKKKKYNRS